MDPYKVLGISVEQVKHDSDLDKVRARAKTLYKRHSKAGKKFDAKKVLEAYELVKQRQKSRVGEGQYKILGRSRKERELDKHFNHQTKDIKKNKRLMKALKAARHGTAKTRIHLPGDKERIPRQKRSRRDRHRRRRRDKRRKKRQVDVNILEGLNRVAKFLPQESKFPKVIKLLHTWIKDYMNADNREYIFKVLHGVANCGFLLSDAGARQDVAAVFEYVLTYFAEWFGRGLETSSFGRSWQVAAVLASQCFTDDAFVLTSTITKLTEALELLEKHKDLIGVIPERRSKAKKEEDDKKKEDDDEETGKHKRAKSEDRGSVGVKSEDGASDDGGGSEASFGERVERRTKVETKVEAKGEAKDEAKDEVKDEAEAAGPRGLAAPVLPAASPAPLPSPLASPGDDDDDDDDVDVLSSGSDGADAAVDVASDDDVLDVGSDGSDVKAEGISLGSSEGSVEEAEVSSEGDVEEVEGSIFATPPPGQSLDLLRQHFVDRCLATLFQRRGPLWARPKIDAFFQELFYRRAVFSKAQQAQVEAWQSLIKTSQKLGARDVGQANNPLEPNRPVVDSREMRTIIDSDSNVWSAKQTFDSRESSAGRVIR